MYKSKKAIPVPLEYWSILYDSDANQAIGFLGNNNPHSKDIRTYKCENMCTSIKWVKDLVDDFEDEEGGHITCCSVVHLQKHIKYVKHLVGRNGRRIVDALPMTDYTAAEVPDSTAEAASDYTTAASISSFLHVHELEILLFLSTIIMLLFY